MKLMIIMFYGKTYSSFQKMKTNREKGILNLYLSALSVCACVYLFMWIRDLMFKMDSLFWYPTERRTMGYKLEQQTTN